MKKELDAIDRMMFTIVKNEQLKDKTVPECFDMIMNDLKAPAGLSTPSRIVLSNFLLETEMKAQAVEKKRNESKIIIAR